MPSAFDRLSEEMGRAELGDKRLSKRLAAVVDALAAHPGESLPKALVTSAALEATYRFMSNEEVTPDGILASHTEATCERAQEAGTVLAIHDTTECQFEGSAREGLGRLSSGRQGFFAHVAFGVDAVGGRPLGILGLSTLVRSEEPPGRKRRATYAHKRRVVKESDRWGDLVSHVEAVVNQRAKVMDREGDQYLVFAQIVDRKSHCVIRAMHPERRLQDGRSLEQAADGAPLRLVREVALSARRPKAGIAGQPARNARTVQLLASATTVVVKRSWAIPAVELPTLTLNVVRVWEPEPPDDEQPVEWLLLTTLPIASAEEVAFIVDTYRRRWLIEELFKALKTGCQYEKLQLESKDALANALATLLPVAWRILLLRHLAHVAGGSPATDALTEMQLDVLRAASPSPMPSRPTVRDALLAVARLGGHIKNNGEPGWLVLYRGFRDLLILERGWRARCDQS